MSALRPETFIVFAYKVIREWRGLLQSADSNVANALFLSLLKEGIVDLALCA